MTEKLKKGDKMIAAGDLRFWYGTGDTKIRLLPPKEWQWDGKEWTRDWGWIFRGHHHKHDSRKVDLG